MQWHSSKQHHDLVPMPLVSCMPLRRATKKKKKTTKKEKKRYDRSSMNWYILVEWNKNWWKDRCTVEIISPSIELKSHGVQKTSLRQYLHMYFYACDSTDFNAQFLDLYGSISEEPQRRHRHSTQRPSSSAIQAMGNIIPTGDRPFHVLCKGTNGHKHKTG